MKIEISKSQLQQIIKEESQKIQKLKVLKEQRSIVVSQLNEMYEEDMDEGWWGKNVLGNISKDELMAKLASNVPGAKALSRELQKFQGDPIKYEKFIEFLTTNFDTAYKSGYTWNEAKQKFEPRLGPGFLPGPAL